MDRKRFPDACTVSAAHRGTALLESLIALLVVGLAGTSLLALASACLDRTRRADEADRASAAASALLDAVSLWSRDELEQRLGQRAQNPFKLDVQERTPGLFDVVVLDSTGAHRLLTTRLHRPSFAVH